MYRSTKTYCHNVGLSCAFRQWRANSHCRYVHGYALEFEFVFEAEVLDYRNWVVDFGGLKILKGWLHDYFDHKTLVAADDPHLDYFKKAERTGLIQLVVVDNVGCEAFAELAYDFACDTIDDIDDNGRVRVVSAQVKEHGANSAIYLADV